jgi:haloacetate dehalogenase
MFEGFKQLQVQTSDPEVRINLRYGGKGPGVLLLHANPLTHVHWHLVAPRLAKDFTVVAAVSGRPTRITGSSWRSRTTSPRS